MHCRNLFEQGGLENIDNVLAERQRLELRSLLRSGNTHFPDSMHVHTNLRMHGAADRAIPVLLFRSAASCRMRFDAGEICARDGMACFGMNRITVFT